MADRQSPGQPPEEPAPEALSLLAFAKSLYHGERADNFFKFLKNLSDQKDINVIFPLTRFRELVQEGVIGALAERNYSYHGLTNMPRLIHETAPQWAQMLKEDGVHAVFLTPG